ncbi:reverse transcriptase domain-containing protein [Tanacetum coccineum]
MLRSGRMIGEREYASRGGRSEKSESDKTNASQSVLSGPAGNDKGKPLRRMQKLAQSAAKEKYGCFFVGAVRHDTYTKENHRTHSQCQPVNRARHTKKKGLGIRQDPGGDQGGRGIGEGGNNSSACPKDYYSLPDIDEKIESVVGFRYKCFLDAYKGYHQVQIAQDDEEKMAFYTDQGTYCYTKMPFGLKNAGATYQRLVDTAFQSQIGRNLEAYVDDMVIKRNDEKVLIADIAETFDNLRRINMKLNPKKCSFGVQEGKFLGYMVTFKGIRANPKKTKAIADMQSPRTLREMQSLSGKLAALKRFLSRSAERSLPFFETLKDVTKENKDEYR